MTSNLSMYEVIATHGLKMLRLKYLTEHHAEQMARALRLNGMEVRIQTMKGNGK